MNCEAVVERLPWLLNRSLPSDEEQAVRGHVSSCDSCRQELERTGWHWEANRLHLTPEAVVAHAGGDSLDGWPAEDVARHLAACPSCAEERDLAAAGRFQLPRRVDRPVRSPGNGWRTLAVAASLFGILVLVGYVQQRGRVLELLGKSPGVQGPRLNIPIIELAPDEAVRGDAQPMEIPLSSQTESAVLILLPGEVPDGVPLRTTLRGVAGDTVWTGSGLVRSFLGDFTLELPASILEPGPMQLEIAAEAAEADDAPADRYEMMIIRVEP